MLKGVTMSQALREKSAYLPRSYIADTAQLLEALRCSDPVWLGDNLPIAEVLEIVHEAVIGSTKELVLCINSNNRHGLLYPCIGAFCEVRMSSYVKQYATVDSVRYITDTMPTVEIPSEHCGRLSERLLEAPWQLFGQLNQSLVEETNFAASVAITSDIAPEVHLQCAVTSGGLLLVSCSLNSSEYLLPAVYLPNREVIDTELFRIVASSINKYCHSKGLHSDTNIVAIVNAADLSVINVLSLLGFADSSADVLDCQSTFDVLHLRPVMQSSADAKDCIPQLERDQRLYNAKEIDLFLLSGQSNMAGRGDEWDLVLPCEIIDHHQQQQMHQLFCHSDNIRTFDDCIELAVSSTHEEMIDYTTGKTSGEWSCVDTYVVNYLCGHCVVLYSDDRIYGFNAVLPSWQSNISLLHTDVDICKQVGFSSACSFAKAYADHQNVSGRDAKVGLLPMAVGSTSIAEWQHDYYHCCAHNSGASSMLNVDEYGIYEPAKNASYHRLTINLFTSALRTVYLAIKSLSLNRTAISSTSRRTIRIAGMLWYQGENDTSDSASVDTYSTKVLCFFEKFGTCAKLLIELLQKFYLTENSTIVESSDAPIVAVSVTTTRPWLCKPPAGQLQHIRSQIRALPSSWVSKTAATSSSSSSLSVISTEGSSSSWGIFDPKKVSVVDACGLPLRADGVHLTTVGYMWLGLVFAHQLCNVGSNYDSRDNSLHFGELVAVTSAKLSRLKELYIQQTSICIERVNGTDLHELLDSIQSDASFEAHVQQPSTAMRKQTALSSGLSSKNFVYGEVSFIDLLSILSMALLIVTPGKPCITVAKGRRRFVSLGCGSGPCVAAALLSGLFDNVIGVEIMKYKFIESCLLSSQLLILLDDKSCDYFVHRSAAPRVCIYEDNFNNIASIWQEAADVVYTCATCYDSDQLHNLFRSCLQLKAGTRIVLIDSQVLIDRAFIEAAAAYVGLGMEHAMNNHNPFTLIGSKELTATWGSCCGYIYERN